MQINENILATTGIDIRIYIALIIKFNTSKKRSDIKNRFMYKDEFNIALKEICDEFKISERTISRHILKLRKYKIDDNNKAIELYQEKNGEIAYILNHEFCNITEQKLCEIEEHMNITNFSRDKVLRVYLYILQSCCDVEQCITQREICENIGLEYSSRAVVGSAISELDNLGFIDVRLEYSPVVEVNAKGMSYEHIVPKYYYSISKRYIEIKEQ